VQPAAQVTVDHGTRNASCRRGWLKVVTNRPLLGRRPLEPQSTTCFASMLLLAPCRD
jgi:hypothetical protein